VIQQIQINPRSLLTRRGKEVYVRDVRGKGVAEARRNNPSDAMVDDEETGVDRSFRPIEVLRIQSQVRPSYSVGHATQ
jgi:hypothetical protein